MMAYHELGIVEQAVRRFRRSHLDAQAAAAKQEMEGEPSDRVGEPWRKAERTVYQAHATKPGDQRSPGPRQ
jgi:hypothetical protein